MSEVIQLVPEEVAETSFVSRPLKYCLLAFSFFFWIIGSAFAAVGGWHILQKVGISTVTDFATDPPAILAALGCLIFIVSSFGLLGSLRENICFLRVYKMFLIIVLVFECCVGLLGFAFWPELKKLIEANIRKAITQYTESPHLRDMIDALQVELECCGSLTIDDWDSNEYYRCKNIASFRSCGVPWTCCLEKFERNRQCGYGIRSTRSERKLEDTIHTQGCLDKGFEFFKTNSLMIGALGVAFTLPLFFGILMAHRLVKQIRRQIRNCDPTLLESIRQEQTIRCCM